MVTLQSYPSIMHSSAPCCMKTGETERLRLFFLGHTEQLFNIVMQPSYHEMVQTPLQWAADSAGGFICRSWPKQIIRPGTGPGEPT